MTQADGSDPAQREALAALLAGSAQGNAAAFEAFYRATACVALAAVRRVAGDALAEDILADTFLQAWRDCHRFDPARGNALAWLLTIARSRALDRVRQELLRHGGRLDAPEPPPEEAEPSPGANPEELLAATQDRARVQVLLGQLPARERWVLSLAVFRDLSQTEIASETGLPLGTVKSLMNRAQHRLRDALDPPSSRC